MKNKKKTILQHKTQHFIVLLEFSSSLSPPPPPPQFIDFALKGSSGQKGNISVLLLLSFVQCLHISVD